MYSIVAIYHTGSPTLEFACLKCGHCSWVVPIFWFLHFHSPTCFFWHFILLNWNLRPWFCQGDPILGIHSIGRGSLIIFEGAHTNKTIGARLFYYGLSRIQDMWILESRMLDHGFSTTYQQVNLKGITTSNFEGLYHFIGDRAHEIFAFCFEGLC